MTTGHMTRATNALGRDVQLSTHPPNTEIKKAWSYTATPSYAFTEL